MCVCTQVCLYVCKCIIVCVRGVVSIYGGCLSVREDVYGISIQTHVLECELEI